MAFKLRSGNKSSFKSMGSSPAKQRTIKNPTGDNMSLGSEDTTNDNMFMESDINRPGGPVPLPSPGDSPENKTIEDLRKRAKELSPAKQKYDLSDMTVVDKRSQEVIDKEKEEIKKEEEAKRKDKERIDQQIKGTYVETEEDAKKRKMDMIEYAPRKKSPAKQKLNKGGEGQDQDKIFNDKGEHIGDYVNDKPVMRPGFKRPVVKKDAPVKPKKGDMKKYSDLEKYDDDRPASPNKQAKTKGLGPRTAFGGVKNPELVKTKKTKSKKVMIDGPKKQVTGVKNPGNWQPHPNTFKVKAKKSTVSKHGQLDDAEIEYQNDLKLLKEMAENKKKK